MNGTGTPLPHSYTSTTATTEPSSSSSTWSLTEWISEEMTVVIILAVLCFSICCLVVLLIINRYHNKVAELKLKNAVNSQINARISEMNQRCYSQSQSGPRVNYTANQMHFHYGNNGTNGHRKHHVIHIPNPSIPSNPSAASTHTVEIDMASTVDNEHEGMSNVAPSAPKLSQLSESVISHDRNSNNHEMKREMESDQTALERVLNIVVDHNEKEMKHQIPDPQIYEKRSDSKVMMHSDLQSDRGLIEMEMVSEASWGSSQMYAVEAGGDIANHTMSDDGAMDIVNDRNLNVHQRGHHHHAKTNWRSEGHIKGQLNIVQVVNQRQTKRPQESMYEHEEVDEHEHITTRTSGSRMSGDV